MFFKGGIEYFANSDNVCPDPFKNTSDYDSEIDIFSEPLSINTIVKLKVLFLIPNFNAFHI